MGQPSIDGALFIFIIQALDPKVKYSYMNGAYFIVEACRIWYTLAKALSRNGRRLPLTYVKGYYFFSPLQKGGGSMVTYEGLFAFCLVLIAVVQLTIQLTNKKK